MDIEHEGKTQLQKKKEVFQFGLAKFLCCNLQMAQFSDLVLNGGSHLLVSEGNLVGLVVVLTGARAQAGEFCIVRARCFTLHSSERDWVFVTWASEAVMEMSTGLLPAPA